MSENTLNDPQPTIWFVMRPQEGFEQIYAGRSVDIPIPLHPYKTDGAVPLESERRRLGYEAHLSAYQQVARGSTVMILFPRIQGITLDPKQIVVTDYTYQLRWRQRPLEDTRLSQGEKRYSLNNLVSAYSTTKRLVIPCSQGEVIKPAYPEGGRLARGIFTMDAVRLIDQQGVYDDAKYGPTGDEFANNALGATGYPVRYVRCDGDELGLVLYRDAELGATWDFAEGSADWPLASTFGTAGGTEPINPGAGVYVCTVARSTTP
jgi:hypothetical protein